MKIEFNSTENLPEKERTVLIQYIKGYSPNRTRGAEKGTYVTQGFLRDEAEYTASENCPEEFWRERGYGLTWFDYSERQIESLTAKKQ